MSDSSAPDSGTIAGSGRGSSESEAPDEAPRSLLRPGTAPFSPGRTDPRWTSSADRRLSSGRATSVLIALPDRIVSCFLIGAIPVGLAVIFHAFVPAVVFPASLILIVALWRWTPSRYLELRRARPWFGAKDTAAKDTAAKESAAESGAAPTTTAEPPVAATTSLGDPLARQAAIGAALALLVVVGWLWVNRQHLSAYLVLQRDPGIYTIRGLWMINHSTPLMDSSREALDAAGLKGVGISSLAFPSIGTTLYPQSSALLPGLLGVLGWFLGVKGVLIGNLLIGALGLLAVYGFGRRLLGPLWALLPMVVLGAAMPMIAFSRGAYSEPVALVSTFGGLTLLWIAWQTGKLPHFFVAGLLIGVGSLARIDGGVTLIGVLAGFAVVTLAARSRELRIKAAIACTAWAVGAGVLDGFSLIDGKINSPVYQSSEWGGIFPLLVATVLGYLVTVGVAFLPLAPLRRMLAGNQRRWTTGVFVAALVIGVIMVSRPLWWTSHSANPLSAALGAMQKGLGLPVDATRTYSESSVSWLGMYLGWPAVVLAALGAALLLARIMRRRDPRLAAFVLTVACVALLYLNQISIFPDQIWAMRRFLPVVLPGFLVAMAYPLTRLEKLPVAWFRKLSGPAVRLGGLAVAGVIGLVVLAGPLIAWKHSHLFFVANVQAQIAEMKDACAAVGDHPVILAGPPPGSATFLPTFKAGCDSEVIAYGAPTTAGLATLRKQFTDPALGSDTTEPLVVVFDPKSVKWQSAVPAPYMTTYLTSWEQPLQRIPNVASTATRSVWIAKLTTSGLLVPLSTGPTIVNGP